MVGFQFRRCSGDIYTSIFDGLVNQIVNIVWLSYGDGIYCGSPPLKRLLKGPPPSFPGFPPLGRQGYSKEQSSPRSRVYRRVHTDRSDPNYDIKILHRMLIETTEVGSCSKPQKEEVARDHRRRKLLETGGSCSKPQKVEFARVHRSRKVLKSTEEGRCSSPQKEEGARVHNRAVVAESCSKGPERQHKL